MRRKKARKKQVLVGFRKSRKTGETMPITKSLDALNRKKMVKTKRRFKQLKPIVTFKKNKQGKQVPVIASKSVEVIRANDKIFYNKLMAEQRRVMSPLLKPSETELQILLREARDFANAQYNAVHNSMKRLGRFHSKARSGQLFGKSVSAVSFDDVKEFQVLIKVDNLRKFQNKTLPLTFIREKPVMIYLTDKYDHKLYPVVEKKKIRWVRKMPK